MESANEKMIVFWFWIGQSPLYVTDGKRGQRINEYLPHRHHGSQFCLQLGIAGNAFNLRETDRRFILMIRIAFGYPINSIKSVLQ